MDLKILIVEPSLDQANLLKKNFIDQFGATVEVIHDSTSAIVFLKENKVNAIVARSFFDDDKIAHQLLNFLYDQEEKTPLLIIGDFEHAYKQFAIVSSHWRIEEINRLLLKGLSLKKEDFKHLKLPDYIPYPIHYFYLMSSAPCDVYIRLSKKEGDEYIKRLKTTEKFDKHELLKYENNGLSEFFVLKEDSELFLTSMMAQSVSELKGVPDEEKIKKTAESFNISSDLIIKLGITAHAKALADATINEIHQQVSKESKLSVLLRKILDNELSFSYRRSYLTTLLISAILPKLEWASGEQQSQLLHKLTMVSYFHDIYLEDEVFLRVMDNEDFKKVEKKLLSTEKELILNHANRSATLLQTYPKLPAGIDLIVKQHHGVSNGVGFPNTYSSSLQPLVILFIVTEEYAHQILIAGSNLNLDTINKHLLEKFTLPSYKKILNELINLNRKSK